MRDHETDLVGVWKLQSCIHEEIETGMRRYRFGENPTGYFVFTATGRATAILTGEGRKAPKTLEDRIEAYGSMLAYSGTYRIDGNMMITRVDVAWDEAWVGSEQIRYFKINDDELEIETPPFVVPHSNGKPVKGILVWRRES